MTIKQDVLRALNEHGPQSAWQLAEELGVVRHNVRATLSILKKDRKCHIASWDRSEVGGRLYPRGVWALGPGEDAKKPRPLTRTQYYRRSKRAKTQRVTSVFDLGTPAYQRRSGNWSRIKSKDKK